MEKFLNLFAAQFEDVSINDIHPEKRFRDIEGWDSFIALSIMAMIDEEYDVKIKPEEMQKSQTIKDIYDIVNSRSNAS